ncbi:MAG: hypothetical protein AUG51_11465 [Acidobacteria bacterium 13_1_20CM_3_53_8]|nr:MAG: hypothetical protein AUG51_11465 [Acidobacteria bacterium 13_1_20CM_3_53_8]
MRLNRISRGFIIPVGEIMSEESTQNIPDGRSFEERVFARFDAIDARLQRLEDEAARRALETKPIWERALAEILEVRQRLEEFRDEVNRSMHDISRKMAVLANDMVQLRADQTYVENRMDNLESK